MTQCKSFWLYMTQCKSFWLYMNLILVEYESIFESHFGCIWISSWLNMNQFLNRILVVYESHFGCVWISFWLYMKIILVVYWNCFGCQKNKTNSLLTSSEGNGFWERPIKSKYIERVLRSLRKEYIVRHNVNPFQRHNKTQCQSYD